MFKWMKKSWNLEHCRRNVLSKAKIGLGLHRHGDAKCQLIHGTLFPRAPLVPFSSLQSLCQLSFFPFPAFNFKLSYWPWLPYFIVISTPKKEGKKKKVEEIFIMSFILLFDVYWTKHYSFPLILILNIFHFFWDVIRNSFLSSSLYKKIYGQSAAD